MRRLACSLAVLLALSATQASTQETKIRWFGHAAFSITTPGGRVLLIDPWLTNPSNPEAKEGSDPLAAVPKADYILLTHGHRDHVGDAVAIAKKTGAALVANPELAANLVKLAGFPKAQASTDAIMGIGGEIVLAAGEVTVAMTPAVHTSSVYDATAGEGEADRAYGGSPAGFVVAVRNGPTVYHSGDTAYFGDMEVLGEEYAIDLALVNIGGHYGMEPRMAARAAQALRARLAVPHHFGTAPGMAPDTTAFAAAAKARNVAWREMKPGQTLVYRGKALVDGPTPQAAAGAEVEVLAVWNAQAAAWNRGDLEGFMAGYWRSPDLVFFSNGSETRGWQPTLDRYRARYQSGGAQMGKLDFPELDVELLGDGAALVRGRWRLRMPDGKAPSGMTSVLFRRLPEGWRIVHDHSSSE